MGKSIAMSFSGGKDSSYALYTLLNQPDNNVVRLLSTATSEYQRTSMHCVRLELLEAQANSIGIPLDIVWLSSEDGGEGYKAKMRAMLESYRDQGIGSIAFGDLYLEDVRAYREEMNASVGLSSTFPVWGIPTKQFARNFIQTGFKAVVVCVDTTQLDASFCGREYNESFLADLPEGVDWCAERGEFHTFCYDGPIFKEPILFHIGQQILRDERFYYTDLVPRSVCEYAN